MAMQHWTKLHTGVRPRHSTSHAACCIAGPLTGEKHPLLMVIGGQLDNGEALDDVWLLDVDDVLWTKVGTSSHGWLFRRKFHVIHECS